MNDELMAIFEDRASAHLAFADRVYGGRVFIYARPFLGGVREIVTVRDGFVTEHYYGGSPPHHKRENISGKMSKVGLWAFGMGLSKLGFEIVGRWTVEDWDYFNSPERCQRAGLTAGAGDNA